MKQVSVGRTGVRATGGPCFDTAAFWLELNKERLRREKELRASGGSYAGPYSWARVAREAHISRSTMSNLEGGAWTTSVDVLIRLLTWLGRYDLRPFVTWGPDSAVVLPPPLVEHDPVGPPPSG